MWPACVSRLSPYPLPLQPLPKEIQTSFEESGWQHLPEGFPIQMVSLLGMCSTDQYKECPTLPEWHIENAESEGDDYLEEIGVYYWCDFDLKDKNGRSSSLRMVFNAGDADCNDGTWGMVWDRNTATPVAELTSVGDCEGAIKLVSESEKQSFQPYSLPIPDDNELFDSCGLPFTLEYASNSEFEKWIGVAMRWCVYHSRG